MGIANNMSAAQLVSFAYMYTGHGPFSHLFDGMFIPHVMPGKEWKVGMEFLTCLHLYTTAPTHTTHTRKHTHTLSIITIPPDVHMPW